MNRFSRIRHHVDMKDVKKRHLEETAAEKIKQKQIEEEKRLQKEIYDAWKSDWRKDMIDEGMTTTDMFQFLVKGEDGNLFTTGTGFTQDGTHQLQNIPPMNTVDDPHNVGTALGGGTIGAGYQSIYGGISQYDGPTQERDGIESSAWKNRPVYGSALDNNNNLRFSDYIYPFDREATEAEMQVGKDTTKVLGQNDTFRAVYPTNVVANRHKIAPIANPENLIGLNAYDTIDGVTSYERCGLGIAYGGEFDSRTPRFFVPAAVDARHIDSIEVIGAIGGHNSPNSPLLLYYWSGDKPGFQSLQSVNAHPSVQYPPNKRQYDGWRPIAQKPNGEIDPSVSSTIMDLNNLPAGTTPFHVGKFVVPIPEWCRSKNTRFMYLQLHGSASPRIFSIGYQRRNNAVVVAPLDDPKSSSFVRVGPGMDGKGAKERAKKVNDMLKASREYMLKSLGYASLFNDEVKISDVVSNDLDFFSVMQGSGAFGNSRFNDLVSLEKRQKAAKIARARQTKTRSGRGFRGYQRTGRDSKGMTTRARFNPNDIIGEGMTTSGLYKVVLPAAGDTDLETVPLGVSGGHAPVNYGTDLANSEEDPNTIPDGTEYTALTNLEPMTSVEKGDVDDTGSGQYWMVRTFDQATQSWQGHTNIGDNGSYSYLVPGFKNHTMRNVSLSGAHRNREIDHPTLPGGYHPTSTFGSNDKVGQLFTNPQNKDSGAGVVLNFTGPGSPRFIALKPVDATELDTIKVHALVGDSNLIRDGAHSSIDCRPQIYYWAGNHPDFKKSVVNGSIAKTQPSNTHVVTIDGWRPINMKPNGDIDPSVDPFIIKYRQDEDASGNKNRAPGFVPQRVVDGEVVPAVHTVAHNRVYPYSLKLPEWTQTKGARFMIIQHFSSNSPLGSSFSVSSVRYQRKNAMPSFARLDDPKASSFIRVGQGVNNQSAKQRRKRVRDMIKASLKYGKTKFGDGVITSTNID